MTGKVTSRQIRAAFQALADLQSAPGRTRTERIQILRKHRRNPALKAILLTASHPYKGSKFLLLTLPPPAASGSRISTAQTNWRKFMRLHRAAIYGRQTPKQFFPELRKFYGACSEREVVIYHQTLTKKLKVGAAARIAAKVWPEFNVVLPASRGSETGNGLQIFFVVEPNGTVHAITPNRRPYPLLADRFGELVRKLGRNIIFHGTITSFNDAIPLEKFLNSKAKSMTRAQFLFFYRSMRVAVTEVYSLKTAEPIATRKRTDILRRYRKLTRSQKCQLKLVLTP